MKMTGAIPRFFLVFNLLSFLSLAVARGGQRVSPIPGLNHTSSKASVRHLLQNLHSQRSLDLARGYMTNNELEKAVKGFAKRCSEISRIYSIGKSVSGFSLWVIEISDQPGEKEPEPAFKFIGNVHGDEPVGRELLFLLANWICDNSQKDPLANFIVQNVHLHILPSMNPDGFALRRRENANNVDLNRDFPDQFFPVNDDIHSRQPETRAIMNWLENIQFTASATLHGGALVANYPWDGTENRRQYNFPSPDDEAFRFLAKTYSLSHRNMSLSKEFEGGITNGAAWYPIYGGMQDWNYIEAGCFELTLEISDNKWPDASEIPIIWEYNRMSMLNLVASVVKTGVHGRVFASDSGKPLPGSITIRGINYTLQAGRALGDYHRLLAPGERYEVIAAARGYKPKTTSIWLGEEGTALDFILNPEDDSTKQLLQNVCDCNCRNNSIGFIWGTQQMAFMGVIILGFFCVLVRRRVRQHSREKQIPKRSVV